MRVFLYSIWLPIAVLVIFVMRATVFGTVDSRLIEDFLSISNLLYLFAVTWPCGLPLTFVLMRLHRHSRIATGILIVLLVPLSGLFAMYGGLFGPFGTLIYSASASIPAWVVWGIYALLEYRRRPDVTDDIDELKALPDESKGRKQKLLK